MFESAIQDIRYVIRTLFRSPGYAIAAIVTLALGIGANTAVFTILNAVMLRPLPYYEPERLIRIRGGSSFLDLNDIAQRKQTIETVAGYREHLIDLSTGPYAERIPGALVTGNLFSVLGSKASSGRLITVNDDRVGSPRVAVISDGFRKRHFPDSSDINGKTISIAGIAYSVIGVAPADFQVPLVKAEIYLPFQVESVEEARARGAHTLTALARLKRGISIETAQSDLDILARQLEKIYPDENTGRRFLLIPLHESLVRNAKHALLILFAAVGFVLLIACANVTNLSLSRASSRTKEIAVRASLGAGRFRLARLLLTESVVIALLGGVAAVVFASWLLDVVVQWNPGNIPRLEEVTLDFRVFTVTTILSLITGVLCGLAPAFQAMRLDLQASLKEGVAGGVTRPKLRTAFASAELALALILLTGAGLLLRSFYLLQNVDPGFPYQNVLTFNITLPLNNWADIGKRTQFYEEVIHRLQAVPGVESIGATTELPFGTGGIFHNFEIDGRPLKVGTEPEIWNRGVTSNYFQTIGISLVKGRLFTDSDRQNSLPVAIVNQRMVDEYFRGQDPIGKRVAWARDEQKIWMTIVGVVGNIRGQALNQEEVAAIYTPISQEQRFWKTWMNFVARVDVEPESLIPRIRSEVAAINKTIPVVEIQTMEALIASSFVDRRFQFLLLGMFAFLAMALATVGVYGVIAYSVGCRKREIGVRLAIGAQRSDIFRWVLTQGMIVSVAGVLIGLTGSFLLTRLLAGFLFSITPTDPITLASVTCLLVIVTLAASLSPAYRASRTDPVRALKYE